MELKKNECWQDSAEIGTALLPMRSLGKLLFADANMYVRACIYIQNLR